MGVSAFTLTPATEAAGDNEARVADLEDDLILTNLRAAMDNGWSIFDMQKGFGDEFHDETGVLSNTLQYNSGSDFYQPTPSTSASFLLQSIDETNGATSFTDSTGSSILTAGGDAQHSTAVSKFGTSSVLFDGSGDFVSAPDASPVTISGGTPFTCAAWIYPTSLAANYNIMGQWQSTGNQESWFFRLLSTGEISLLSSSGGSGGAPFITSSGAGITINNWHYVVLVHDGTNTSLYANGTRVATTASSLTLFNSSEVFTVGAVNTSTAPAEAYVGYMDDVLLSNDTALYSGASHTVPTSRTSLAVVDGNVVSVIKTAGVQAEYARIVSLHDPVDSVTYNTDAVWEVSRDGGTTWTAGTMSNDFTVMTTLNYLTSGDIDISGQPAGTSMQLRFTTANAKDQRLHAWGLQWR